MSEERELWGVAPDERDKLRAAMWAACASKAASCTSCGLAATRNTVVFGEGDERSKLMFIGEGPGEDEDVSGRPFIGRAGQLLSQILSAAGIEREKVYITNVVKCRPPKNRNPLPEEESACDEYLKAQIMLIEPAIIVLLGAVPAKWLLKTTEGITQLRGRWFDWHGISVMPMFHPSYLLRYSDSKKPGSPKHLSWIDIQEVKRKWDEVRQLGAEVVQGER